MKLLIITAIEAFEKEIKKMLKSAEVETFSYTEVKGYKSESNTASEDNWFAGDHYETESLLFYAFVKNDKVEGLFDLVEKFNAEQATKSNVHLSILNIEKSNH